MSATILDKLLELDPARRDRVIRSMSVEQRVRFLHDWKIWGRAKQQWQPDTRITFVTSGRGWGKTRMGAEICHDMAGDAVEKCGGVIGIAGRTHDDVVKDLVQSKSGILATQKPWNRCKLYKDAVSWENGSVGYIMSGDKPEKFRGKNTGFLWCDEFAHWKYPQKCYDAFEFDVRNGTHPCIFITSTPLPLPIVTALWNDPETKRINGHTDENADNLPVELLARWKKRYQDSELGKQELSGIILDQNKNAPFDISDIKRIEVGELPTIARTIVMVDPPGGGGKKNAECGITVGCADDSGNTYLLADYSGKMGADEWASKAIYAARYHNADAIGGETNYGGDMVMTVIRQHPDWPLLRDNYGVDLREVWAGKGKADRAVPVNAMYQQGRIYHVGDPRKFDILEYQMTHFDKTLGRDKQPSPDRMDSWVHCVMALHPDGAERTNSSAQSDRALFEWQEMLGSLS